MQKQLKPTSEYVRHKTHKIKKQLCVGIITIPYERKGKYIKSHIMKSYVDWFEQRGVRVLPIPYDTTEHEEYFEVINGLLIPGGDMPFIIKHDAFLTTVTRFFELSLQKDEYFPIWGTCFGFELLLFLVGGFTTLKKYDAHGLYPITITGPSKMFNGFSKKYLHFLEHNKSTIQNHLYGISPDDFMNNLHLRRFYNIISTAVDNEGKTYVNSIEGKHYPIYGVQFHPERQKTTSAFIDFFIGELKMNKHHTSAAIPYIGTYMPIQKCIEYREKKMQCYIFTPLVK